MLLFVVKNKSKKSVYRISKLKNPIQISIEKAEAMTPSPRNKRKIVAEKVEPMCKLSAADIKRVRDAKAKSPRTSIPALASILKLDAEDVKLALKMKNVRKKIDFVPQNVDEKSNSSTAENSSAPTTPIMPSFDSLDELFNFTAPTASTSSGPSVADNKCHGSKSDSDSDGTIDVDLNTIATHRKFFNSISKKKYFVIFHRTK